jgi:Spy/CpxP family protein refolding chaperone
MADYLNLTPAQRAEARKIRKEAREQSASLRQQLKQDRAELAAAVKSGNDAQIDRITKAEAPLMAQMAAIRAHAREKMYATLTPAQKAKAETMRKNFMTHRGRHERTPQATS